MLKPENKFRYWFADKFQAFLLQKYPALKCRVQKHADYATHGIPDLDIILSGITVWVECKCLQECVRKRKLDVPEIQRQTLKNIHDAGAPAGLLVGLSLGPRKGYLAAFFSDPYSIPQDIEREYFGQPETVFRQILTVVDHRATKSLQTLKSAFLSQKVVPQHGTAANTTPFNGGESFCGDQGC